MSPGPPAVAHMHAAIESDLGPVDILVNNAGIVSDTPLADITEADWDRDAGGEPEIRLSGDPAGFARHALPGLGADHHLGGGPDRGITGPTTPLQGGATQSPAAHEDNCPGSSELSGELIR